MGDAAAQASVGAASSDAPGSELLNDVREVIRRYCALPGEHELNAVVLWCALTHLVSEFDYAPRLVIRSAEKRSGKSRLLEILDGLVHSPLRAVNATTAYVFRSLDKDPPPTLLFDEVDTIFGSRRVADKNEDLRGLLNAGFQRGLPFGRVVGSDLTAREFNTFAMAALAGIGRMPETIEDRAVVVVMKRHRPDEPVQPFRPRRDGSVLEELRHRLAAWADSVRERAGQMFPEMPVDDRAADLWEPLIVVADLAGGDWPALARGAAVSLTRAAAEEDAALSLNLQLLVDIRAVFEGAFMKSEDLCTRLRQLPESPWDQIDLNPTKLGKRLREYSVKTRHTADKTERGYYRSDFVDAFQRYLPPEMVSDAVHPVPIKNDSGMDEDAHSVSALCPPAPLDEVDVVGRGTDGQKPQKPFPTPAVMPLRRFEDSARVSARTNHRRRRTRGRRKGCVV